MLKLRWPFEWVDVVEFKDLPDAVVLEEVRRYFHALPETETRRYSDVSDDLRLPLEQIVDACNILSEAGEIRI